MASISVACYIQSAFNVPSIVCSNQLHCTRLGRFRKHFCGYVREGDDLNQTVTVDNQDKDNADHIEGFDV